MIYINKIKITVVVANYPNFWKEEIDVHVGSDKIGCIVQGERNQQIKELSCLVYLTSLLNSQGLMSDATDRAPGNEMKDENVPDIINTPGFEPGMQWPEAECSTARPIAPR